MTSQVEYGNVSSTTVPGALRGYRFLRYDADRGTLRSPQQPFFWRLNGAANAAECHILDSPIAVTGECDDCSSEVFSWICAQGPSANTHRASMMSWTCRHGHATTSSVVEYYLLGRPPPPSSVDVIVVTVHWDHKHPNGPVPVRDCCCGFYAGYNLTGLSGAPGVNALGRDVVLGVVEASGHTILGTRGFRSEKMRVVSVCPSPEMQDYFDFATTMELNGVTVFKTPEEMYVAYPPEDVRELIGQEVIPDSDPFPVFLHPYVAFLRSYHNNWFRPTPTTRFRRQGYFGHNHYHVVSPPASAHNLSHDTLKAIMGDDDSDA